MDNQGHVVNTPGLMCLTVLDSGWKLCMNETHTTFPLDLAASESIPVALTAPAIG
jgi:hypothetical protein